MYEFLVVWGGRAQRFFRLLRAEAARLVLKLRAASCWLLGRGGLPAGHQPWALGGRIRTSGLRGQKGEEAGMPLGVVVTGRAW
jgi:hypothetical protein